MALCSFVVSATFAKEQPVLYCSLLVRSRSNTNQQWWVLDIILGPECDTSLKRNLCAVSAARGAAHQGPQPRVPCGPEARMFRTLHVDSSWVELLSVAVIFTLDST